MGSPLAWGALLLIVGVIVVGVLAARAFGRSSEAGDVDVEEAAGAGRHVRYEVPEGQDPAVVIAALMETGHECAPDTDTPRQVVTITLDDATPEARERVRAILADTRSTNLGGPPTLQVGPVRFLDETGQHRRTP